MYETETDGILETVTETPPPDTGFSDVLLSDISAGDGLLSPAVSPSDDAGTFPAVSSGDGVPAGVWTYNPVSGGDIFVYQYPLAPASETAVPDYTETLAEVSDRLSGIEKTLTLVFLFLLLSWTASRIPVAVRRFTRERR